MSLRQQSRFPLKGWTMSPRTTGRADQRPALRRQRLRMAWILAALTAACGSRFDPPHVGAPEIEAARQSIADAEPVRTAPLSPSAATLLLVEVSQRLADAAQPLCSGYLDRRCHFRVSLEPSDVPTASMSGQGEVAVTLGMVRLAGGADELAAVVGHEFAHQIAGHIDRQRARGLAAGAVAGTVVGMIVPFGGIAGSLLGLGASQLSAGAVQLVFSKDEEREADYVGAYLVARAGFAVERSGLIWLRLARREQQETVGFLRSHPSDPERLAAWRLSSEEIRRSEGLVPRRSSP